MEILFNCFFGLIIDIGKGDRSRLAACRQTLPREGAEKTEEHSADSDTYLSSFCLGFLFFLLFSNSVDSDRFFLLPLCSFLVLFSHCVIFPSLKSLLMSIFSIRTCGRCFWLFSFNVLFWSSCQFDFPFKSINSFCLSTDSCCKSCQDAV